MVLLPDQSHHAGGIENRTLACGKRLEGKPRRPVDRLQIDALEVVPLLLGGFMKRLRRAGNACIVVHGIDAAKADEDCFDDEAQCVAVGYIGMECDGIAAGL